MEITGRTRKVILSRKEKQGRLRILESNFSYG
jgi:hypothetical protein